MSKSDVLINYLNQKNDYIPARKIAGDLGLSIRTVQNYIKEVKEQYPNTIETSHNGIKFKKVIGTISNQVPSDYQERKQYIVREILINHLELIIEELADYFCISYLTLENELRKIRKELLKKRLKLRTRGGVLFIDGDVHDKKNYISDMIFNESRNSLISYQQLDKMFSNFDIKHIRQIIINELNANCYYIDEFSLVNLILHIVISMDQNIGVNANSVSGGKYFKRTYEKFEKMVDNICDELSKEYNVIFSSELKRQYVILLTTRVMHNDKANELEKANILSSDDMFLLNNILTNVKITFDIDLSDYEFEIPFIMHIKNMLVRLNKHIKIKNPLLSNIKYISPFTYDIAVYISKIIQDTMNVKIHEDEIAYIALHIGSRIEKIQTTKYKLKVALIDPLYFSYDKERFDKIKEHFSEDFIVTDIVTHQDELINLHNYDFIISTIQTTLSVNNILIISNFFNHNDRNLIQKEVERYTKNKKRKEFYELFKDLFDETLFFTEEKYDSQNELLNTMANRMIAMDIVTDDYLDKLLLREEVSSTNYGDIAIPHPINSYASRTTIEVSILKDPIKWNDGVVRIVFMLAISRNDYSRFQEMLGLLVDLCRDQNVVENLYKAKSYEEFINFIMDFCNI